MKRIACIVGCLLFLSYPVSSFAQDKKEPVGVGDTVIHEMYVMNGRLYIKNAPVGKKVEIFTIIGNKVREFMITSPVCEFDLNLPRAIYLVRLDGITRKCVIKL